MRAGATRSRSDGDGGQLLLLAGIVLVIAFVVTALTLTNLGQLEKQASEDQNDRILTDYRFIREKTGTTLHDVMTKDTKKATAEDAFETLADSLRVLAHEKGYDLVMKIASGSANLARSEWSYTQNGYPHRSDGSAPYLEGLGPSPVKYHWRAYNNTVILEQGEIPAYADGHGHSQADHARNYDGTNDGFMHTRPCNKTDSQTAGAPVSDSWISCIKGIVVYIYLADATTTIEEFVVYGFNTNVAAPY